jgi:hypothetical protein
VVELLPDDVHEAQRLAQLLEATDRDLGTLSQVAVVRWPDEWDRVMQLRRDGVPHLLLVAPRTPAVPTSDPLEDWARLPLSLVDLRARVEGLRQSLERRPRLDGQGRLIYQGHWVGLSVLDERLARPLVQRFEHVVRTDDLLRRAWSDGSPPRNVLHGEMRRLRVRIAPLDLAIVTIRGVGYLLQPGPPGA